MNEVTITLLGRDYTMACEAGAEASVQALASKVEGAIAPLKQHRPDTPDTQLFAMGLLMLQDQLNDVSKALEAEKSANAALPATVAEAPAQGDLLGGAPAAAPAKDTELRVAESVNAVAEYIETLAKQLESR